MTWNEVIISFLVWRLIEATTIASLIIPKQILDPRTGEYIPVTFVVSLSHFVLQGGILS